MVAWYKTVLAMRSAVRIPEDRYALLVGGGSRLAIVGRDEPGPASARWSLAFEVADLDAAKGAWRLPASKPVPVACIPKVLRRSPRSTPTATASGSSPGPPGMRRAGRVV